MLYMVFEYYLLLNLALFQMLIVASPEPHKTINEIMLMFQADSWLKTLHNQLISKQVEKVTFDQLYDGFD